MTSLHERVFDRTEGLNPRPSEYQADAHPTELPGLHMLFVYLFKTKQIGQSVTTKVLQQAKDFTGEINFEILRTLRLSPRGKIKSLSKQTCVN